MSEFDGIREREDGKNKMPVGMRVLFAGLIVFGLLYWYLYTPQTSGWNQTKQYEENVKQRMAVQEEHLQHEAEETPGHEAAEAQLAGPAIYKEHCAMCHGEKLEGGIGPSLLGPKFIYGARMEDHVRVTSKGTENGMPGFAGQIGAEKVRAVSQYIYARHAHQ